MQVGMEGQRGAGAGEALGTGVGSRPGSQPHLSGSQRPTQLGPEELGVRLKVFCITEQNVTANSMCE